MQGYIQQAAEITIWPRLISLLMIISAVGSILLCLDYYIAWNGRADYGLFWFAILLEFTVIAIAILFGPEQRIPIWLFIFGFFVYLIYFLGSPSFASTQDELIHWQGTRLILQTGTISARTTLSTPLDRWYPGCSIGIAALSMVSNIGINASGKILVALAHSLLSVFLFFFYRAAINNSRIGGLAALIYAVNPQYVYFDSISSYESLAILEFGVILYLLLRKRKQRALSWSILILTTWVALIVTHHVTSMFGALFVVYCLVLTDADFYSFFKYGNVVLERDKSQKGSSLAIGLFAISVIFAWMIYNAIDAVKYLGGIAITRAGALIALLKVIMSSYHARHLMASPSFPLFEVFVDKYLYPIVILGLVVSGVAIIIKRKIVISLIGGLMLFSVTYFATWPFILTKGADVAFRSWASLMVGPSLLIAISIIYYMREWAARKIAVITVYLALLVIAIGGISLGADPRTRFRMITMDVCGGSSLTAEFRSAADWYDRDSGKYQHVLGDLSVAYMFGRYGEEYVDLDTSSRLFQSDRLGPREIADLVHFSSIVVDKSITRYLAWYGSYFKLGSSHNRTIYGSQVPLPIADLRKFNGVTVLDRDFDAGDLIIYRVRHQ